MKKLTIFFLTLTFMSSITMADNFGWRDKAGNFIQNTDQMKSINGFGGSLVVTLDKDWQEKWDTPAEDTPTFEAAEDVGYGVPVTVLIFFTNPKANDKGKINIACDIQLTRPDGTYSVDENDVNCANWQAPPEKYKYNIQLTQAIIKFVGEPNDLPGTWLVTVNLKDKNSNIEIPLKTTFNLVKN